MCYVSQAVRLECWLMCSAAKHMHTGKSQLECVEKRKSAVDCQNEVQLQQLLFCHRMRVWWHCDIDISRN